MLIVMKKDASPREIEHVVETIRRMGLTAHPIPGTQRTAIGVTGNKQQVDSDRIANLPGVQEVIHVTKPYYLVSRENHPEDTVVDVGGVLGVAYGATASETRGRNWIRGPAARMISISQPMSSSIGQGVPPMAQRRQPVHASRCKPVRRSRCARSKCRFAAVADAQRRRHAQGGLCAWRAVLCS